MAKSGYTKNLPGTKYTRRVQREGRVRLPEMTHKMLSGNKKTGAALNLPLSCCRPSARCAETCYAMEGFISSDRAIQHSLVIDRLFRIGEGMVRLIKECRKRKDVRLNGIGDFITDHLPQLFRLVEACPKTIFWGFTRKKEIAVLVNGQYKNLSLVLSWDATHHKSHVRGYKGPLAYGPIQPGEKVPNDKRIIVVFPEHHQKHPHVDILEHKKDCPATRIPIGREYLKEGACQRCQRCMKPHEVESFDTTHFYGVRV